MVRSSTRLWSAVALSLALPSAALAQADFSNFGQVGRGGLGVTFATDYQAIGVNPANLSRVGSPKIAFTVGEFGFGVGSQSLTKATIRRFLDASGRELTQAEKQSLSRDFTSDNALNLNADATTVAVSLNLPLFGTLALSNRQRVSSHVGLNKNAAEIMFLGREAPVFQNFDPATAPLVSEVLDGTKIQLAWYNEYNVAFGRQLVDLPKFRISGGVGYRYIQGVGVLDVQVTDGKASSYSALSPLFDVDYGKVATQPGFNLRERANGLQPVGKGYGFDFGVAIEAGKLLRVGIAVTDIGRMKWEGNLLTAQDQKIKQLSSDGVNSYDFFTEAARIFAAGTDSLFVYEADQQLQTSLPSKLRVGAGLRMSENLEAGVEVSTPLNQIAGSLPNTFVGAALDYKPWHWLRLSSGVNGGAGYGFGIPLGITLTTPIYEAGISTRDVTGFVSKDNPYVSGAAGFLRFRLGKVQ
ncbi:hypothetical protein FY528_20725 [Hymenobacter lutimineralis]|uniref:DUF5723 domain-containing protein n=1 Tax=Hymenobacter lutimineralis TaxID=2606448 RepID=A0A5D6URW9_9BACT|nr:DUF5723 family protein [Hymenobacter lutimineralis]TYZ05810.1 hypothetical protein FY528_20725 [Hymenobacter lutimineralis]